MDIAMVKHLQKLPTVANDQLGIKFRPHLGTPENPGCQLIATRVQFFHGLIPVPKTVMAGKVTY